MLNTYREIFQQPEILKWSADLPEVVLKSASKLISDSDNVYIVGSGSAYHAGLFGSYILNQRNKIQNQPIRAGEFSYNSRVLTGHDLVLAVSQSGESHDIVEAVLSAKNYGAIIVAITNERDSKLAKLADELIITPAGNEKGVMATKTLTAQMAVFLMLSFTISDELEEGKIVMNNVSVEVKRVLSSGSISLIRKLAKELANEETVFAIGRDVDYAIALETALKLKEGAHIHAEGFSASDFMHGPKTLIKPGSFVLTFVSDDGSEEDSIINAIELHELGAKIIGIGHKKFEVYDKFFQLSNFKEFTPIVSVVYSQLLAYFLAKEKGLNPDKPKYLSKIVK